MTFRYIDQEGGRRIVRRLAGTVCSDGPDTLVVRTAPDTLVFIPRRHLLGVEL